MAQHTKIGSLGILTYFDSVVISEEVRVKKPDKRVFQHALRELGVDPCQALFIGDHPVNDVVGASAAGLMTVWLRGRHVWPTEYAEPILQIDIIDELISMLGMLPSGVSSTSSKSSSESTFLLACM